MEKNDEKLFDVYHGKNNNWQSCISYLRIFATICVIYLHTCSTLSENQELFDLYKTSLNVKSVEDWNAMLDEAEEHSED